MDASRSIPGAALSGATRRRATSSTTRQPAATDLPKVLQPGEDSILRFVDLQKRVDTHVRRDDLLFAGGPQHLDALHFLGITQAEIERQRTLGKITGFAIVVL